MKYVWGVLLILSCSFLAGCERLQLTNLPQSPTLYPSVTPLPSQTPTPTVTPTPTLSATPTPITPAHSGESLSIIPQPLTKENAPHLTLLSSWGRGIPQAVDWSSDSSEFAVATTHGIYRFDGKNLTELPARAIQTSFRSVAYSLTTSDTLAVGTDEGSIFIWNHGSLVNSISAHSGPVLALAFSPDGSQVASSGWDNLVQIWNVADGSAIQSIKMTRGPAQNLAFTPDGKGLTTWSPDDQPVVWSLENGKKNRPLFVGLDTNNHSGSNAAFSPEGTFLVVNQGYRVRAQRTGDGTTFVTLNNFPKPVLQVAVSNQGNYLATVDTNSLNIWDGHTRKMIKSYSLPKDSPPMRLLTFSPDDMSLVTISDNLQIYPLNPIDERQGSLPSIFSSNYQQTTDLSRDGSKMLILHNDGWMDSMNMTDGQIQSSKRILTENPNQFAISSNGHTIAVALANKKILFGDINVAGWITIIGHKQMPSFIALSPDGNLLASTSVEKKIFLWDTISGKLITQLEVAETPLNLIFSPMNDLLSVGLLERTFLYRTSDWSMVDTIDGNATRFSPDGLRLAQAVKIDGVEGIQIQTIGAQPELPLLKTDGHNTAFSLDGNLLAVSGRQLTLWDTHNSEQLISIINPAPYSPVFFSPDGNLLGLVTWDGVVYLYGVP